MRLREGQTVQRTLPHLETMRITHSFIINICSAFWDKVSLFIPRNFYEWLYIISVLLSLVLLKTFVGFIITLISSLISY